MGMTDLGEEYYQRREKEKRLRDIRVRESSTQVPEEKKPPTRFERILEDDDVD